MWKLKKPYPLASYRCGLRGNVWENQRCAPTCRHNLCSYSGYQKYSWIQGPWAIWFQLSMYHRGHPPFSSFILQQTYCFADIISWVWKFIIKFGEFTHWEYQDVRASTSNPIPIQGKTWPLYVSRFVSGPVEVGTRRGFGWGIGVGLGGGGGYSHWLQYAFNICRSRMTPGPMLGPKLTTGTLLRDYY